VVEATTALSLVAKEGLSATLFPGELSSTYKSFLEMPVRLQPLLGERKKVRN